MNNCVFTTHATLTKEHAEYSLRSLLSNQTTSIIWDWFIIYNTHSHTIDNDWLQDKIKELDVNGYIQNLAVFPYEELDCPKTLTQDLINQFSMLIENGLNSPGKTLLLKSDYCVSRNFNKIFSQHSEVNSIWSLPIYNAKSKVPQTEIDYLCYNDTFEITPKGTYYRGGTNHPNTPGTLTDPYKEYSSNGKPDTDPSIRFVSHNIQNDYNLHVFTNDVIAICNQIVGMVFNPNATWGGAHDLFNVGFNQGGINRSEEIRAFGVHMYHSIKSENHNSERGDERKLYKEKNTNMILISHRGNTNGKFESYENEPAYIDKAISEGFDVEIDVWMVEGQLFLGHDEPQYGVTQHWLNERYEHLWVHCKNVEAMEWFNSIGGFNYFWHQEDMVALTSMNIIWAYPGKQPIIGSIAVMPEIYNDDLDACIGICSDYINDYK